MSYEFLALEPKSALKDAVVLSRFFLFAERKLKSPKETGNIT